MIDIIDHRLKEWITTVIDGKFEVTFAPPGIKNNGSAVSVYLFSMENSIQRPSVAREMPLQITLSYLLTVHLEDQIESHRYLGNLLVAAKSRADFEVEFPSLSAHFWQAFGVPPLPHFSLRVPLTVARDVEHVPRIKIPPRIDIGSITYIKGCVLGSADQPIANAKVTLINTKTVAYTDNQGLFSITADAKAKELNFRIDTKGQQFEKSLPAENIYSAPIIIHLNNPEV